MSERSSNILAVLALLAAAGIVCLLWPWPGEGKDGSKRAVALSDMKESARGLQLYSADFDNHYPPVETWRKGATIYRKLKSDPTMVIKGVPVNSAMNAMMDKSAVPTKDSDRTVLVFLAQTKQPGSWGGPAGLWQGGDQHRSMVCFVDGSTKSLTPDKLSEMIWRPRR